MEITSIIVSISMMIFFTYRGFSVVVIAPLSALLAVFLGGDGHLLACYTQIFMRKLGEFIALYFPLFLLSAIFGKMMEGAGYAKSIAEYISNKIGEKNAILAVVLYCSILTYGGVSVFVVIFAVYPVAVSLFRKSNIPKRLMPTTIAIGTSTYTMTTLPGSPAIHNAIPSEYFCTNIFAAPGIGIIISILLFVFCMAWMYHRQKIAIFNNEGYGHHHDIENTPSHYNPDFWLAITPIFIVIVLSHLCIKYILPNIDSSYLQHARFGSNSIKAIASNWSIISALFGATAFISVTNFKKIDICHCLNKGTLESFAPIFNIASVVGFGAVISLLPGFITIRDGILSFASGDPVSSIALVTSLLGGITGSALGGMSLSLEMLGSKYLEIANSAGINSEIMHRIVAISSSTLHALPHNGGIISLLTICGLNHKESFMDIFVVCSISSLVATIAAILLHSTFGTF